MELLGVLNHEGAQDRRSPTVTDAMLWGAGVQIYCGSCSYGPGEQGSMSLGSIYFRIIWNMKIIAGLLERPRFRGYESMLRFPQCNGLQ